MSTSFSRAGEIQGTVAYMSPEHARGEAVDVRSDIFSFGIMLYEMVCGRLPFHGRTSTDIISSILKDAPPPPSHLNPEVSPELEQVILKCLMKDPSRRYQSAKVLQHKLSQIGIPARFRVPVVRQTHRLPLALSGALALALIGLLTWQLNQRQTMLPRGRSPGSIVSLVALPSNVVAAESEAYLADAIPKSFSSYLAQVEALDIRVPVSSIEFDKVGGDLSIVADAYNVDAFFLSNVSVDRDQLLLQIQLADARTRRLI